MSQKQLGARLLQRLGACNSASPLRNQSCTQAARSRGDIGGTLVIHRKLLLVLQKAARKLGRDRRQAMDYGATRSFGPLPPAWWLQCSHSRAPLGHTPSLARIHSHSFHKAYGDAAAADRQTSCSAMQASSQPIPASAASHAAQQPKAHLQPASQRQLSSMAAKVTQMAPPKWGGVPRSPTPRLYEEMPAQWVGAQDVSTGSCGTRPPLTNGSPIDTADWRTESLSGEDAAVEVAALGAVAYSGVVEGLVRHITFRAADTGYTVLKVEATIQEGLPAGFTTQQAKPQRQTAGGRGRKQNVVEAGLATVTGNFEALNKGQRLRFEGRWVEHPTFGNQLHASRFVDLEPGSLNSLAAFLGSGAIPGVGPKTAKYMVEGLGDDVLTILDGQFAVDALKRCKKIGKVLAEKIKDGWEASRGTRNSVTFLQGHGLTAVQAQRVVNRHGVDTEVIILANPYMAMLGGALNFSAADELALQLGASAELAGRGAAAMLHELGACTRRNGHTFMPWAELQSATLNMLQQTGRPWRDGSKLLVEAQRMQVTGELAAESAHQEARVQHAWLAPASCSSSAAGSTASAAAGAGNAAQSLEEHMLEHVSGVGPAVFKMMVLKMGAENIAALLDGSDARRELQKLPSIGPAKSEKMAASWVSSRHLLPELPTRQPLQAPEQVEALPAEVQLVWDAQTRCYAPDMYRAESTVASVLARLAAQPWLEPPSSGSLSGSQRVERWIDTNEKSTKVKLSAGQREAVRLAASAPILVLTGGPGCGKTFATATIVKLWHDMHMNKGRRTHFDVALCAPTGRAAQRLEEVTRVPSKTIHRLLGVRGRRDKSDSLACEAGGDSEEGGSSAMEGTFEFCAGRPLGCDALLLDEASMLDLPLAAALLDALPRQRRVQLVLVGDADQLPPVGPGGVLEAAIASGMVPVIDLRQIFRQAQESAIITSAHAVNSGQFPNFRTVPPHLLQEGGKVSGERVQQLVGSDAMWVRVEDWAGSQAVEEAVLAAVEHLLLPRIDVARDLQVMSPMKKGPAGTRSLNRRLQALLNPASPDKPELTRRAWLIEDRGGVFRLGDRVIQVVNDYETNVFNGDQGFVTRVTVGSTPFLEITFPPSSTTSAQEQRVFRYSGRELDVLDLAWATTVHKAQGGEAKAVLLALSPSHRPLLSRRLLYTGLTRAKELLVVVGTEGAISSAVQETRASARRRHCVEARFRSAALEAGVQEELPQVYSGPDSREKGVELDQLPLDVESIRAAYA